MSELSDEELAAILKRLKQRIGHTGPIVTRRVEAGALIKFARATGETNPLFTDEDAARAGPYGEIAAPPTYVSVFAQQAMVGVLEQDLPLDTFLHTDDAVEMGVPILAGDIITATAHFADAYVRTGRNGPLVFQVAEMKLTNQNQQTAAIVRIGAVNFKSSSAA